VSRFSVACIDRLPVVEAQHSDWNEHPLGHCLADFIAERASFLKEQGRKHGDFIWQQIDDNRDLYCSDPSSKNLIAITRTTVRIDSPSSKEINRRNQKWSEGMTGIVDIPDNACESDGTSNESLVVSFADGDLIQISTSYDQYFSGMPHGQSGGSSSLELIAGARELKASDIFKAGSGWQAFVAERLYSDYRKAIAESGHDPERTKMDFLKIAEETGYWSITQKDLTYGFGQYQLGGYAAALFETAFTWRELRSYLRADLPFHPDLN